MNNQDAPFTYTEYQRILTDLKASYRFIHFNQDRNLDEPTILMRHDIDTSVTNAYEIAKIESAMSLSATYFLMLGNWFYDIRDRETHRQIHLIRDLGHEIALHYDFDYLPSGQVTNTDTFVQSLNYQKNELEHILGMKVGVVSLHNPTVISQELFREIQQYDEYLGMVNVYSKSVNSKFKYCSDSNGLWRFDKLQDLVDPIKYRHLHVLTHPEWWTEFPLSPREKIQKALSDRSGRVLARYDALLLGEGRPNF